MKILKMKQGVFWGGVLLVFTVFLWSCGRNDIPEEERQRIRETEGFVLFPLSVWLGVTDEVQKIVIPLKVSRTNPRYRFSMRFPDINESNEDELLWVNRGTGPVRIAFNEVFSFVVEDVKTGEVVFWYNESNSFRNVGTGSRDIGAEPVETPYLVWSISAERPVKKLKKNREYRVHIRLPGIENTPELKRIQLNCFVAARPFF